MRNESYGSSCLRPFINMLDGNAVELALQKTEKHVKQIISSEIYASRDVRLKTATSYFDDLTQDDFSKDLICFKDFINSDKGQEFRYKSLPEETFNLLIKFVFNDYFNSGLFKSVRSQDDLKTLLYANGIVAEKVKPGGKIYQFASMYTYVWALKSSELDKETTKNIMDGMELKGYYSAVRKSVCVYGKYYKVKNFSESNTVFDGDNVSFILEIDQSNFQWAKDVKLIVANNAGIRKLIGVYKSDINSVVVSENDVTFEIEEDAKRPRFMWAVNVSIQD